MGTGPTRRQFLAGAAGASGLGMFGLLGSPGCKRHISNDRWLYGRTRGKFGDWSAISPREMLFETKRADVVIIGSGYGGAVSAARLAGGGAKVFVLERGLEWLPGDFPESLDKLLGSTRSVDPLGLFDFYTPTDSDWDIIAASGVGGTSLINAAISTKPEPLVFDQPEWPAAIRAASADGSLWGYYDRASEILSPNPYGGPDPTKVAMHRRISGQRGNGAFSYLPLNVAYSDAVRGAPKLPVQTHACKLCGNCTTGCNVGAKGTLQTNYLPHARSRGAHIFAGVEVDRIERTREGRWRVHYIAWFAEGGQHKSIEADHVVVAGGSLGSTEILMRSAAKGLRVSPLLGTRVSANGDIMGFCYAGDAPTNLVGEPAATAAHRVGNALMSYVDYRGEHARGPDLQDRFLLLEGTIPVSVANTVAKGLALYAQTALRDKLSEAQRARVKRDLASPTSYATDGALVHSTLYLACGHDDARGRYEYRAGNRPRIVWKTGDERFVATVSAEMREYTKLRGGHYIPNPRSTVFGGRLVVPHPLGGCPMSEDIRAGVVDHVGRVFDPAAAAGSGGVHRGLHVLDGSIIPRSLAATPLLTICALAERATESIGQRG